MREKIKLAGQMAIASGTLVLLASCTTAKVYSVVPADKPSTEEIAMLTTLQATDTSGLASTEMASVDMQPVDMATDKSIEMAYAIPVSKPIAQANEAMAAVQVASADPAMTNRTMAEVAVIAEPAQVQSAVMTDTFDRPELTPSAALAVPKTRSIDPFVTSTKNTNLNQLIAKYAALYEVPEPLIHHVVRRESNYNPNAVHRGNWGLMQIRYNTAKGLGYEGNANGLLDAETNLKYAVKYLKGAWIVAEKDAKKADWLYRTGYYYQAKQKQLLDDLDMQ
ncbi:transglycosylase SLT domain-containing protein [Rhizobium setariae]